MLDTSPVADWCWTIDRLFLAAFLSLMGFGFMLSFAASPAVAERIGLDSFHFATRQIVFLIPSLVVMCRLSFLDAAAGAADGDHHARRLARADGAALFFGVEVKGARRWMSLAASRSSRRNS